MGQGGMRVGRAGGVSGSFCGLPSRSLVRIDPFGQFSRVESQLSIWQDDAR